MDTSLTVRLLMSEVDADRYMAACLVQDEADLLEYIWMVVCCINMSYLLFTDFEDGFNLLDEVYNTRIRPYIEEIDDMEMLPFTYFLENIQAEEILEEIKEYGYKTCNTAASE